MGCVSGTELAPVLEFSTLVELSWRLGLYGCSLKGSLSFWLSFCAAQLILLIAMVTSQGEPRKQVEAKTNPANFF